MRRDANWQSCSKRQRQDRLLSYLEFRLESRSRPRLAFLRLTKIGFGSRLYSFLADTQALSIDNAEVFSVVIFSSPDRNQTHVSAR